MPKLLVYIVFLFLQIHAKDQPAKPPSLQERMSRTMDLIKKEVTANQKQTTEIEKVFEQFFKAAENLRSKYPPPSPGKKNDKAKAACDKLENQRNVAIKKILTPAQFVKYSETEKKLRPPHLYAKGENGPPPKRN